MPAGIGLEIGATAIRAAVLERQGKTLKLLAWKEVPCDASSPESLTQGLSHLRRALKPKGGVILGMPSSSVLLTTVEPLVVDARRAPLAVEFELQQNLPFALDQAAWNFQWLNGSIPSRDRSAAAAPPISGQPMYGSRAIVAAMKQDRLEEPLASCRRAGLRVQAVTMSPLAVLNIWKEDVGSVSPGEALLLYVGETQAEWIVWSKGGLQVVPIAVNPSGVSMDALVQEIGRSLESLRDSGHGEAVEAASTWVVGPNAHLPDLEGRLVTALQMRVASLDLNQTVAIGGNSIEPIERAATAFGLALQGVGRVAIGLNLLTEAQDAASVARRRRSAFAVGGLAALLAAGFGASGMLDVRRRYTRALEVLEKREQVYQNLRPEIRTLIQSQSQLEDRIRSLRGLVSSRSAVGSFLVNVNAAMPDEVWLTKVEATRTDVLEGFIEGRGKSFQAVTAFIEQLKLLPGVRNVKPLSTKVMKDEKNGREIVVFSVVIQAASEPAQDHGA